MTHRIELLRPSQIRAELARKSLIYIPLGTIEWHCEHLPVGLDALTAHGLCLQAAELTGGLVWPALYYGTGGDHGAYPWTVMTDNAKPLEALLEKTLKRLGDMGVERAVLFSGHFANEQLAMIDEIARRWRDKENLPHLIASAVNRFGIEGYEPDHAGRFETTLLAGYHPETIDMSALPPKSDLEAGMDRHNPRHPLWGIIGTDPRSARLEEGPKLSAEIVAMLADYAAG